MIKTIHPDGLKPVADAVHKAGGDNCMLDLGKAEMCDYAIETISNLLKNEHID